ncbi:DNA directed RNA polymerase [Peziza echinospora]|nr:DNA directed RNA polymerase [Peziza echinospora]
MNSQYSQSQQGGTSGSSRTPVTTGAMYYLCAECGAKVGINKGEHIRCKECGHRVLYKQRTKRSEEK